jgi:DNA-binding response OmpR family regulator
VVVLDVMMPYIDGFDVLDAMRRIPGCERLPVIMETANPSRESGRRAVDSGLTYMLAKPLDLAMLVRAVTKTIRQSRAAARAKRGCPGPGT